MSPTTAPRAPIPSLSGRAFSFDRIFGWVCAGSASGVLLMLAALVTVLVVSSLPAIREFGFKFLVSSDWRPNELEVPMRDAAGNLVRDQDGETVTKILPAAFGALPVIYGTIMSALIALAVAVPIAFGAALFLVRTPWRRLAGPASALVEFLAAIPSIAYGLWGLFMLAPLMQNHFEPALAKLIGCVPFLRFMLEESIGKNGEAVREIPRTGRDLLTSSLVLAIMVLPIITSISRDVLRSIPRAQIDGVQALGGNWWQTSVEMLNHGKSALFGAVMLGLARAIGETMAVTMVIGNNNQISPSPFAPAQTMSSLLANEFAEASTDTHRGALTFVALILLAMSLVFNVVARWWVVGRNKK